MWAKTTAALIVCYMVFTRGFAYIGLPSLGVHSVPLFIGEGALAAFLILKPGESFRRWFGAMTHPSPLSAVAWAVYFFVAYGLFEAARGIFLDSYPTIVALQNLAFNFYPLFLFLGVWVGLRNKDLLPRLVVWLAWVNGTYGVLYILILSRLPYSMPGSPDVPVFSPPGASTFALMGLLLVTPNLRRAWLLLSLNAFVLLGLQVRAFWAAFLVALFVWALIKRQWGRLALGVFAMALMLTVALVFDVRIPATGDEKGEISTRNVVGAAIAPFNPELAAQFSDVAPRFYGTTEWRRDWWRGIWSSVHERPVTMLIGHGYGFPLSSVVGFLEGEEDIRTPHNIFLYALGYGGWLGVAMFAFLISALGRLLWRGYRLSGNAFGIVALSIGLTIASFGNYLETPFGAIPFYLLLGLAVAPAISGERSSESPAYIASLGPDNRNYAIPHPSKSSPM